MIKKICPVCDLPLTGGKFCVRCKKIVKNPYIQDVDYYLNESHPAKEENCEFHNPYLEADHHGEMSAEANSRNRPITQGYPSGQGRPATQGYPSGQGHPTSQGYPSGQGRPAAQRQPSGQGHPTSQVHPSRQNRPAAQGRSVPQGHPVLQSNPSSKEKTRRGRTAVNLAVAVIFLILAAVTAGRDAMRSFSGNVYRNKIYGEGDYEYEVLEEAAVREAGIACNSVTHFPADGISVKEAVWDYVKNYNGSYTVTEEIYSDNYTIRESGEPDYNYYETVESLNLTPKYALEESVDVKTPKYTLEESETYQYVDVNYDTGNGQLHGYVSMLKDQQASIDFLKAFLTAVGENSQVEVEESSLNLLRQQVEEMILKGQSCYLNDGIFEIGIYTEEKGIRINVNCNNKDMIAKSQL